MFPLGLATKCELMMRSLRKVVELDGIFEFFHLCCCFGDNTLREVDEWEVVQSRPGRRPYYTSSSRF